jgi:hypothetical protein
MPDERALSLVFPVGGLHEHLPFTRQPEGTCPDVQNMRPHDPGTGRSRGAQRPGLSRHINAQVNSTAAVQCLDRFVTYAAYSGANTLDTRTIKGIAVAGGTIKTFTSSFATPTNGSTALASAAPVIHSTSFYDDVYFADGTNTKFYDSSTDTVSAWPSTAGSHPGGGCRLIATYRNRIILSGLASDPQNFFASAVGLPGDFDYSPATITSEIAFAGNSGNAATIPDKITALCPIPQSDVMLFGCDHSIYQMTGDIAAGGKIDDLSTTIGMAYGKAFCFNPEGLCYFFGSRGGVYVVAANSTPTRLTGDKIDERLASVDLSDTLVTMAWDDRQQGACLFFTPLDGSASTNYFYDQRNDSWWKDVFADANHNPVSVHLFDGDTEGDRAILTGSQDGYIRKIDITATNDDASAISSYIYIGPLYFKGAANVLLKELQATLGVSSSDVTLEVFKGESAQAAFTATVPSFTDTIIAGRNWARHPRTRDETLFLKLSNSVASQAWAMEKIDVVLRGTGRRLQRTFG